MKYRDEVLASELRTNVLKVASEVRALPGVNSARALDTWVLQMIDSIHRVRYPGVLRQRPLGATAADPAKESFDPLKAAILHDKKGNHDEASWLVFLFVHFGKSSKGGWRLLRDVYGMRGTGVWSWIDVSTRPTAFREWLAENELAIRQSATPGGFGNHRKYESLNAWKDSGTGAAVQSYIDWIGAGHTHRERFDAAVLQAEGSQTNAFDQLYSSMDAVRRFGRTAKFDYLCMLGKLQLARIVAPRPYLSGATGPLRGASLLFTGAKTSSESTSRLEEWTIELDSVLRVGMQVLEDSLCNWQKSPESYRRFYG